MRRSHQLQVHVIRASWPCSTLLTGPTAVQEPEQQPSEPTASVDEETEQTIDISKVRLLPLAPVR